MASFNEFLNNNLKYSITSFAAFKAYCNSKFANYLFTYELARRLGNDSVTVNICSPGMVFTNIIK